jgi:hypothetical protein
MEPDETPAVFAHAEAASGSAGSGPDEEVTPEGADDDSMD